METASSDNGQSETSFDDLSIEDVWETELEIALLENAEFAKVRSICKLRPVPDRLRRDLWCLCLNVESNSANMSNFAEIFDLPNQEQVHNACERSALNLLSELSISSSIPADLNAALPTVSQLTSDFESVLTHFSQTYNLPFTVENGWIAILDTLYRVLRPIDRSDLYVYFASVFHRFVASGLQGGSRACNVFRLLLQYHEPELCNFLDSHQLGPEVYIKPWLVSLFAGHLSTDTLLAMWDIYFVLSEPQFGMFVALILLVNAKNRLIKFNTTAPEGEEEDDAFAIGGDDESDEDEKLPSQLTKSREELLFELQQLPVPMQPSDVVSLVEIAQVYKRNTPDSVQRVYLPLLFGGDGGEDNDLILHGLSLMVSVEEILSVQEEVVNGEGEEDEERVRFLLVDCRPAEQYNAGHLATAFYLDTEVMLSNPPEFNTIAQALLQSQQRSIASGSKAAGEHIAFMGSGRQTEDRVVNMVIAHFLRLNTTYVSLVDGGYAALHDALGPLEFNRRIVSHEADLCFVCASNKSQQMNKMARQNDISSSSTNNKITTRQSGPSVFSKLSNLIKKNSPQQIAKPLIAVPITPINVVHKPQASYRNTAAVFSIDDNDEDEDEPTELSSFKPNVFLPTGKKHVFTSLEHCSPGDQIDMTACRNALEVQCHFKCHLFNQVGQFAEEGVILLLERHFIVAKEKKQQMSDSIFLLGSRMQRALSNRQQQTKTSGEILQTGIICASIPLSAMIRITSNKRIPEVITFHYSRFDDLVSESMKTIRMFIPKAGDAVKAVKLAVFKVNAIETDMPVLS